MSTIDREIHRKQLELNLTADFWNARQRISPLLLKYIWQSVAVNYLGLLPDTTINRILQLTDQDQPRTFRKSIFTPKLSILHDKNSWVKEKVIQAIRVRNRDKYKRYRGPRSYTINEMARIAEGLVQKTSARKLSQEFADLKIKITPQRICALRKQLGIRRAVLFIPHLSSTHQSTSDHPKEVLVARHIF